MKDPKIEAFIEKYGKDTPGPARPYTRSTDKWSQRTIIPEEDAKKVVYRDPPDIIDDPAPE